MSEAVTTRQQELAGKYRPYPEYKDSGVEWLQLCPSSWETKALKYIVSCNDEVLSESTDPDMEFEYIDIGGVSSSEGITRTESMRFSGAPSRARRIVRQGDIIVSTVRTYLEAIAPISLEFDGKIASTGFAVLRPKYLLSGFAKYALRARHFIDSVVARSTGVSYPAINSSELIDIKIVVPSLKEQQTIASFLDYETARIDRLIAQQQRLIELLKEKRQAVISHAVTKGLNPNAPMKDSGVEWLGQVPEHWKVGSLRWYLRVSSGEYLSNQHFDLEPSESAIYPVIGGNGVMGYTSHKNQATPLVVGRVGALCGNVHLVDGECWVTDNALLIGLSSKISVNFAAHYLKSLNLNKLANQNTQPLITGTMIKDQNIALPSLHEQSEIVEFVTQEEQKLNLLVAKAEQAIVLMQERRTALIAAAVTGKIDLRGWTTPADEVAV
ncbi:restriction endonuclease subunit S [Aeromonas veronii]|uniref:restriction endonuclease subunit S n=1 Tax=Aeromonas veronii TaxID=654 RepID=UPI0030DF4209